MPTGLSSIKDKTRTAMKAIRPLLFAAAVLATATSANAQFPGPGRGEDIHTAARSVWTKFYDISYTIDAMNYDRVNRGLRPLFFDPSTSGRVEALAAVRGIDYSMTEENGKKISMTVSYFIPALIPEDQREYNPVIQPSFYRRDSNGETYIEVRDTISTKNARVEYGQPAIDMTQEFSWWEFNAPSSSTPPPDAPLANPDATSVGGSQFIVGTSISGDRPGQAWIYLEPGTTPNPGGVKMGIPASIDLGSGWYYSAWLGAFYGASYPVVTVWGVGAAYIDPAVSNGYYIRYWDPSLGWLSSDANMVYDGWFYSEDEANWIYRDPVATWPRLVYSFARGEWRYLY